MKLLHLNAMYKGDIELSEEQIKQLPKNIGLVASVQYLNGLQSIKKQLQGAVLGGQVLGCRVEEAERIAENVDAFLYVGTGKFHPIAVHLGTKKEVYCYNPMDKTLILLHKKDVQNFEKQRKVSLSKYLMADIVGILVSAKNGQFYYDKAEELIKIEKEKNPDKELHIFACNTIDLDQFQNFPFIQCWVNTACPRIVDEKPNLVNVDAIFQLYNLKTKEKLVN